MDASPLRGGSEGTRPRSVRSVLLLLVLAALLPAHAFALLAVLDQYRAARDAESGASAEVARAVARSFEGAVQELPRTLYALGVSIAGHGHGRRELQLELDSLLAEHPTLRSLSWLEPGGRVVASTDERLIGASLYAREYIQEVIRGSSTAVSPLIPYLADGSPVFAVARAVALRGAPVSGIVVGVVDPQRLGDLVGAQLDGRRTAVYDRAGVLVLAHPPPADASWDARRARAAEPFVRDATGGRQIAGEYLPASGSRWIGATAPIPSLPGWFAHTSRPYDQAMAPVRAILWRWGATALGLTLAALGASLLLARRITGPLRHLESQAARVADGAMSAEVVRGPLEVERVSRALADMAASLSARLRELAEAHARLVEARRGALHSAAELDALFTTAPVGLIAVEPSGVRPRANRAAMEINERLGIHHVRTFAEYAERLRVVHPERGELALEEFPISRALRGEIARDELLHLEPRPGDAGTPRWISVSAAPLVGPGGEIEGAIAAFADVTEIRELQEERETLMQMVSHDLRTPLHVVVGHGQLLRRGHEDADTVHRRAEAILASALRMQRLIDDLVDAARLERGRLALDPSPVDLAAFLRQLRGRLAGALEMERVRIVAGGETPIVLADPARLEQIVVNLVTNALKYSVADSEVVVALSATSHRVELSVQDRGPGIAPDELPRLFDRYFRGRTATRAEGLGLGLFITRKLVEAHGWGIRVESTIGRGTTFTVIVPLGAGRLAGAGAATGTVGS